MKTALCVMQDLSLLWAGACLATDHFGAGMAGFGMCIFLRLIEVLYDKNLL